MVVIIWTQQNPALFWFFPLYQYASIFFLEKLWHCRMTYYSTSFSPYYFLSTIQNPDWVRENQNLPFTDSCSSHQLQQKRVINKNSCWFRWRRGRIPEVFHIVKKLNVIYRKLKIFPLKGLASPSHPINLPLVNSINW